LTDGIKGGFSMDYNTARELSKRNCYRVYPLEIEHKPKPKPQSQTHTHEFLASTELALHGDLRHKHRFAGVTGEAIPVGQNHIHKLRVNTSFNIGHFHEVILRTGPGLTVNPEAPSNEQVHIHFVEGETTVNGAVLHDHDVKFATLIAPNPPV